MHLVTLPCSHAEYMKCNYILEILFPFSVNGCGRILNDKMLWSRDMDITRLFSHHLLPMVVSLLPLNFSFFSIYVMHDGESPRKLSHIRMIVIIWKQKNKTEHFQWYNLYTLDSYSLAEILFDEHMCTSVSTAVI